MTNYGKVPHRRLLRLLAVGAVLERGAVQAQEALPSQPVVAPPQLNGQHFRITALQESGFLDINTHADGSLSYAGYLIDVLEGIASEGRANFTYDLVPPSGYGSLCSPRLQRTDPTQAANAYESLYHTQYNCGASDVTDVSPIVQNTTTSDMYLGMYYVTPARQLLNQFTIPFLPPASGTLQMFGYATGIPDFPALVKLQAQGLQPAACAPGGTALLRFVETAYPGLQVKGVFGGNDDIYQAFVDGTCQVYIVDGPVAAQFVLRLSRLVDQCTVSDGRPIGLIGQPMDFGLSHYAIGIRRDVPREVEQTLSYWLNVLMSCSPQDPDGACPDG
jgi:ABC-type amino acid transport substrate-binding protein